MAMNFIENGIDDDDEYIDMEITSFSNFFSNSRNSREFEFQMSSLSIERDSTTSPADELFYNGKLLPLHLPPHLLQIPGSGSVYSDKNGVFEEFYGTSLANTTVTTPTSTSTPFESCNISPCDSCCVSRELNPDEYSSLFFDYSTDQTEVSRCIGENPKKSWTKRLKLSSKLKASRAYLKAFFGKSGCSHQSSAMAKDVNIEAKISKPEERQFKQMNQEKVKLANNGNNLHRRSFSMAIKRCTTTNKSSTSSSSSSSSSANSNGSILQFLKRSSSVNTEIESPIQSAISHCKRSQMSSKKTDNNITVFEDQERPNLCRG